MTELARAHDEVGGQPEAQLRGFIRHAPVSIAMFDRAMNYIAASDRWLAAYGRGHASLVGLNHYAVHPDLPERWKAIHQQALAGATLHEDEDLWIPADGSEHWLSWTAMPWRDETGAIGGIVMSSEDITPRKRGERVLRESEQRYAAIFERSPFGITLTRASDGVFVDANAAFLAQFEFERSEVLGKNSSELRISDPASRDEVIRQLAERGEVREVEVTRTSKTGAKRVVLLDLDWITLDGVKHILTTVRDVTELRRAQQAAALYEKSKELDRLKTELFANVSHELRTPLALILGPTEQLLAASGTDLATRRQLEVVRRNAQLLSRYVEDLLEIARIDAGRAQPVYAPVDIPWLARFVAGHFQTLATDHHIAFSVDAPERFIAEVDREMVQRIIVNIVGNAFRFTPDGGKIRISVHGGGPRFRIEIADSGPGIPRDDRVAVFDRFSTLRTARHPYGGTGLGLAIVKELVELLAGSVAVGDAPEGGALLVVELPVAAPRGAVVQPMSTRTLTGEIAVVANTLREPPEQVDAGSADGQLVLVVEDNREMNAFLADCLGEAGLRIATAFDGAEGIAKALELRPDLVLTDVMMPRVNGDELIRTLREHRELDATPIVVLSAKADAELRVKLLREGAQDWLTKPFSASELEARVVNLLARKRAEERVAALQRQVDEVTEASRSVAEAVASLPETSVRAVLQTIALKARALTSAEVAAVGLGTDPSRPFDPWVYVGVDPARAAAIGLRPHPIGILAAPGTFRTRDVREYPGHHGLPARHPDVKSFLATAIKYQDTPVGMLYLANKLGAAEFTEKDEHIVEMLAARVGLAIETARLYGAVGKERSWLQAVVDQMPEPVVLMDEGGRVTTRNLAAEALAVPHADLGHDPFGNPITLDLRTPSGQRLAPEQIPVVRALRSRESTHGVELVIRGRDGKGMPVLASATPIVTGEGELAGATMLLQDISALKELERLREEWSSLIAHDLQQPINAITLITELLLRSANDDKNRERIERVRRLSAQLSRMVGDLSDASQLEAHRLAIRREELDMVALVREVVEHVPGLAARARLSAPDERLLVEGDAGRLEQVLTNLLSNAIKYGMPDTPITVGVERRDRTVHVAITNLGAGIPQDELPRVFDRFVRTRAAIAGETKGSGLGLYIAKGLIEAHGGHIWAESTPGSTTFQLSLPLRSPPMT
ncbi:MAG TPA: ATP-binding protein [Kofleriaceae bacterium]